MQKNKMPLMCNPREFLQTQNFTKKMIDKLWEMGLQFTDDETRRLRSSSLNTNVITPEDIKKWPKEWTENGYIVDREGKLEMYTENPFLSQPYLYRNMLNNLKSPPWSRLNNIDYNENNPNTLIQGLGISHNDYMKFATEKYAWVRFKDRAIVWLPIHKFFYIFKCIVGPISLQIPQSERTPAFKLRPLIPTVERVSYHTNIANDCDLHILSDPIGKGAHEPTLSSYIECMHTLREHLLVKWTSLSFVDSYPLLNEAISKSYGLS